MTLIMIVLPFYKTTHHTWAMSMSNQPPETRTPLEQRMWSVNVVCVWVSTILNSVWPYSQCDIPLISPIEKSHPNENNFSHTFYSPRQGKLFSSSSFYTAGLHPTVEDQVELARRISHSLSDMSNQTSKGQTMYVNRKKRSVKWVHEGGEGKGWWLIKHTNTNKQNKHSTNIFHIRPHLFQNRNKLTNFNKSFNY